MLSSEVKNNAYEVDLLKTIFVLSDITFLFLNFGLGEGVLFG